MKVAEVFDAAKMFYETIDVWTLTMKQNYTWVNYCTKIMPSFKATGETGRVIETDRIKVLHESHDIGDFSRILEGLKGEKMNVCGFEIKHNVAGNFNPDQNMEYLYREWIKEQYRTEYPLYKYEVRPTQTPSSPRNIETELMSQGKPYKDCRDVMQELLRIESSSYNWGSVYILLPVFLSLKKCFFNRNALRFTAEFHKGMANQIVLGFILRKSGGKSIRYSKPLKKNLLKFSGSFCHYEDHEPVDNDVISAELILRHGNIPFIIHSKEAIRLGLSSPLEMFRRFWSEDYLLSCLKGELEDRAFEWGISSLLTLCGFKVLWVGWGKGKTKLGGADMLALYKDTIIVAECTIGTVKTDKIDRLLSAVDNILETLTLKRQSTQKIIPLIFTCSEISSATIKGGKESGVKIKGPEEIAELYDAVLKNKPIEEIISLAERNQYNW